MQPFFSPAFIVEQIIFQKNNYVLTANNCYKKKVNDLATNEHIFHSSANLTIKFKFISYQKFNCICPISVLFMVETRAKKQYLHIF